MVSVRLIHLSKGSEATIQKVEFINKKDLIAQRLCDLGFTAGTLVKIVARTPFAKGPLSVKLKTTQFAMRYTEAARILVIPKNSNAFT